jgi:hypothetical protein
MTNKKVIKKVISWVTTLALFVFVFAPGAQIRAIQVNSFSDDDSSDNEEDGDIPATPSTANDSVEDVPLGELVAHWTFDDNYTESVSGLQTSLGAKKITYTKGVLGKAAVFNGKDNYLIVDPDAILNLGNSNNTDNSNFTISAWVNLGDSPNREKYLLDKGIDCGWDKNDDHYWTNPYRILIDGCEPEILLSNAFEDVSGDPDIMTEGYSNTSGKYVEGGEWFLLTVTYDGKRVKVYHDNELINQLNYTDGITFNNDELYIGTDHDFKNLFQGYVDDLRIYTATLSYDEIDALYQAGLTANKELVEPTKQLVAYYAFDDNLKDSSSFINDAEKVTISGTTKYIVGENGKAITMSKGNYIRVPAADQLNFDTEYTVSFWIKLNKEGTYPILVRQNPCYSNDDDNQTTYGVTIDTWGDAELTQMSMYTYVYDPDNWTMVNGQGLTSEYNYEEDKLKGTDWIHYTFTYKDGQMKSYLNGELDDKTEMSDLINISNAAGDLLIGYDGTTFINGAIDELKIYNSCLSATDVEKEAKRVDSITLSSDDNKSVATIGKGKSVNISSILLKDVDTGKNVTVKLAGKNFTLKSSNTKIFTVSEDGKITGVKAGKAKLTITYGPHTVSYNIVVK